MRKRKSKIFTIGYDGKTMTATRLVVIVQSMWGLLIDCRSSPRSRKPGFGQRQLEAELDEHYKWSGEALGGRNGGPTKRGIKALAALNDAAKSPLILMCKEELPGDCHRSIIADDLWVDFNLETFHIVEEEVISHTEFRNHVKSKGGDYAVAPLADQFRKGTRR